MDRRTFVDLTVATEGYLPLSRIAFARTTPKAKMSCRLPQE